MTRIRSSTGTTRTCTRRRMAGKLALCALSSSRNTACNNYGEGIMIRTLLLSLLLGIAAADGASAQNKTVYRAGLVSCGQWQEHRTTGNKASSYQLQAYVDGFLSGYNLASEGPDFLVRKHDIESL